MEEILSWWNKLKCSDMFEGSFLSIDQLVSVNDADYEWLWTKFIVQWNFNCLKAAMHSPRERSLAWERSFLALVWHIHICCFYIRSNVCIHTLLPSVILQTSMGTPQICGVGGWFIVTWILIGNDDCTCKCMLVKCHFNICAYYIAKR